jgi:GT2 family glycosyltransferase
MAVFLDDHCLPKTNLLESYSSLITANPEIKVLEGWIERKRGMKSPIERAAGNSKTAGGYLLSCNFAIKTDRFFELEGFDENFKYPHMEDYDLNTRILTTSNKVLFATKAKIVHPYRKIYSGWKLGKFEEMSIYYNYKHNQSATKMKTSVSSPIAILKVQQIDLIYK